MIYILSYYQYYLIHTFIIFLNSQFKLYECLHRDYIIILYNSVSQPVVCGKLIGDTLRKSPFIKKNGIIIHMEYYLVYLISIIKYIIIVHI